MDETDSGCRNAEFDPAAVALAANGFVGRGRYRRVECDWFEPEDGREPLWAELRADLPFGFLDDIPLGGDHSYHDLWDAIGPCVRDWNALGFDVASREWRPVPPPATAGRDAFRAVDPLIGLWLGVMLKQTYAQAVAGPKATGAAAAPAGGPSSPNAPASASSDRENASPRRPKGSPSS